MSACERCWTEASRCALTGGGQVADLYREELAKHLTCRHGESEDDCASCAACHACDGSCGTCPYATRGATYDLDKRRLDVIRDRNETAGVAPSADNWPSPNGASPRSETASAKRRLDGTAETPQVAIKPEQGDFLCVLGGYVHIFTSGGYDRAWMACGGGYSYQALTHASGDEPRQCSKCWEAMRRGE